MKIKTRSTQSLKASIITTNNRSGPNQTNQNTQDLCFVIVIFISKKWPTILARNITA